MKKLLLLLLIPALVFAQTTISDQERSALLALYHSTGGPHWNRTWDTSGNPATWYGIKVEKGTVTEINLGGNLLKGSIPSQISALPNLRRLDLSANNLRGEVPFSVNLLTRLTELDLSENRLSGELSYALAGLAKLRELSIGDNLFTLSDAEGFIGTFPEVQYLDLAGCGLKKVPQKAASVQLLSLNLSNNTISEGFANLPASLTELKLAGNALIKVPQELAALGALQSLDLSNNLLADLPLPALKQLQWLSLENNRLSTVPGTVMNNLLTLNLGRNKITSLSGLHNFPLLQQLYMNNNELSGPLPDLKNLKNLMYLNVGSNNLSGPLPAQLPPLLDLSNNRFSASDLESAAFSKTATEIVLSPQRYDEPKSLQGTLGGAALLTQGLSGTDYRFTWLKNFDMAVSAGHSHLVSHIKEDDFTSYTCEALLTLATSEGNAQIAFFREPISIEKNLATDESPTAGISIYPNPASEFLSVLSPGVKVKHIVLTDLSGRSILSGKSTTLNIQHLPTAVYLLTVETESGKRTFKVIKD